jgi:hypothetical protein
VLHLAEEVWMTRAPERFPDRCPLWVTSLSQDRFTPDNNVGRRTRVRILPVSL